MSEDILSSEHIKEIGRLVVNVSKLDVLLTDLIAAFSETDIIRTIIVVHHQQFSNKADTLLALIRAVLKGMADDEINKIIEPIVKSKAVNDFRSTIAHGIWVVDKDGTASAVRFQARGEFKRSKRPISAKDIGEQADVAFQLVKELSGMRDHFQNNIPDLQVQDSP
jgi:hypothetical protein